MTDTAIARHTDTVARAADTPDDVQPWAELGLKADEYQRIRTILQRRPTSAELAMYSVMWSEHCSYKSSKVHLRQFGVKQPQTDALLVGIGENAGVVDIGDGWAVTFKVESHNHPSFIEPYQGAATGVGGIVRDILAMGARPLAVMDSLRFGDPAHPDTARLVGGVVAGVGGYGNCLGLPNIGGEAVFDACYQGNPLVNALCVGAMRHEDIHLAKASGIGNLVVLYGARTGGDGIGGVSVLASETFDATGPAKRPAVQVGDPFMEKLLIECTLAMFKEHLVEGIQDLGGAGLSCATSELASNGDGGMRVHLDKVPLRDATLTPEEILMSESQERMMAIVHPDNINRLMEICAKWDVTATVIGEVTDGENLQVFWNDQLIVDVPPRTVAHDGPVYERPYHRPSWLDARQADAPTAAVCPRPTTAVELSDTIVQLLSSINLCDREWLTSQYDRYVLGNTISAMPHDSGVIRIDESTGRGVAIALDCNGRFGALDPYAGAQLALSEAYRNVAVSGATPLAVTDCLNFGSPEDPEVMWQFAEAVRGLADACLTLGTPVTGGNVSLYNQTADTAIHPTPVVGVLGVLDDVRSRITMKGAAVGDAVVLIGDTAEEFAGGEWAHVVHGHLGGMPPRVNLAAEMSLGEVIRNHRAVITSAHDLSDGGLAVALAELVLRNDYGLEVALPNGEIDAFTMLFSESVARAVVTVAGEHVDAIRAACEIAGVPSLVLGAVCAEPALVIDTAVGRINVTKATLAEGWTRTLAGVMA